MAGATVRVMRVGEDRGVFAGRWQAFVRFHRPAAEGEEREEARER